MESKNSTIISIPDNVDDKVVLRRVLDSIVQAIDELKGNRGENKAASESQLNSTATSLDELREDFNKLDDAYVRKDGKQPLPNAISYSSEVTPSGNDLASVKYIDDKLQEELDKYVKERQAEAPGDLPSNANLADTISKVNELIDILKNIKILS